MRGMLLGMMVALATGCAPERAARPGALVHLTGAPSIDGYRLRLVPAPGARINARLRPVLELVGGERLEFGQTKLTPDSSYFAAPPEATLERGWQHVKGTLRVGVCPAGLNECRALVLPIDTAFAPGG